jgi:hypothetical protein
MQKEKKRLGSQLAATTESSPSPCHANYGGAINSLFSYFLSFFPALPGLPVGKGRTYRIATTLIIPISLVCACYYLELCNAITTYS